MKLWSPTGRGRGTYSNAPLGRTSRYLCTNSPTGRTHGALGAGIGVGNLYRTLRRMESDGWVTSNWEEGNNGPKKRIYTITSDGEDFLHSAFLGFKHSKAQIELFIKRYKEAFKEGEG